VPREGLGTGANFLTILAIMSLKAKFGVMRVVIGNGQDVFVNE
jgi:hypothetical protein